MGYKTEPEYLKMLWEINKACFKRGLNFNTGKRLEKGGENMVKDDKEEEKVIGKKTVRILGQEYGCYNVYEMKEVGDKTEILWTTKAGQHKKTTVLTSQIAQIDEEIEQ